MKTLETNTLAAFVAKNQIVMHAVRVLENPNSKDWSKDARHWQCQLRTEGRGPCQPMTIYFSQGSAHTKPPTAEDVLNCLANDSGSTDNSFEDWCAELGYDTDSRSAEQTYRICVRQAAELKRFLGADEYRALLYSTEKL